MLFRLVFFAFAVAAGREATRGPNTVNYDGLRYPDGRWRVAFEDRQWRLGDFGY